jgi:hypothetical protein
MNRILCQRRMKIEWRTFSSFWRLRAILKFRKISFKSREINLLPNFLIGKGVQVMKRSFSAHRM